MGFADRFASSVRQKRAFLRERGFASVHLAANAASTGAALTSNAAQVAGLGRIYFWRVVLSNFALNLLSSSEPRNHPIRLPVAGSIRYPKRV